MIFFHFNFLQANLRSGRGGTFMVGPERHLALLRHWICLFIILQYNHFTIICFILRQIVNSKMSQVHFKEYHSCFANFTTIRQI